MIALAFGLNFHAAIAGSSYQLILLGHHFSFNKDMKYGVDIQFGKTLDRNRIIKIEYVEGGATNYDYFKAINALQKSKNFIKLKS